MKYKQLKHFSTRLKLNKLSKMEAMNTLLEEVQQTHTVYQIISWDAYTVQISEHKKDLVVEATMLVKEL